MEQSPLLSNEQISHIFERFVLEEMIGEATVQEERNRIESLKNKVDLANPLVRDIARMVTGEVMALMEERLKRLEDGSSEMGKNIVLARSIVRSLETPYYAITGRSKSDVINDIESKGDIRKMISNVLNSASRY